MYNTKNYKYIYLFPILFSVVHLGCVGGSSSRIVPYGFNSKSLDHTSDESVSTDNGENNNSQNSTNNQDNESGSSSNVHASNNHYNTDSNRDIYEVYVPENTPNGSYDILEIYKVNPHTRVMLVIVNEEMDKLVDYLEDIRSKYRELESVIQNEQYHASQMKEISNLVQSKAEEFQILEQELMAQVQGGTPATPEQSNNLEKLKEEYQELSNVYSEAKKDSVKYKAKRAEIFSNAKLQIGKFTGEAKDAVIQARKLYDMEEGDLTKRIQVPLGAKVPSPDKVRNEIKAILAKKKKSLDNLTEYLEEASRDLNQLNWDNEMSVFRPENISKTAEYIQKAKSEVEQISSHEKSSRALLIQEIYKSAGIASKLLLTDGIQISHDDIYLYTKPLEKLQISDNGVDIVSNK